MGAAGEEPRRTAGGGTVVTTLVYTAKLVVTNCWCGIRLAIPDSLYRERAERHPGSEVWCPLGHQFVYGGDAEAEKLKRQLKWAEDQAASARAERDQAEASRRAWKGQATKLRNRVVVGECPFCGQHLRDLSRHLARIHPDETAKDPEAEPVL